jgi:glycosyltransferase involved in cell wall biosynthesis
MNCLVLTPHRSVIAEVAERVGQEWEKMGHRVEYDMPHGAPARIGSIPVGIPGIALWWRSWFKQLADNPTQYDLIWVHQPVSPTLPARDDIPWNRMILTFHTTEHAKYQLTHKGIYPRQKLPYRWITKQLERQFYTQLEAMPGSKPHYTVVSPQLHNEIATFGIKKATLIPNGVFRPKSKNFESIRSEYGIPQDATLIFNIGRLEYSKRPVMFVKKMADICSGNRDIHCIMAGDGPLADAVATHTSRHVQSIGYITTNTKWRWFADADIFASLSAYEGMPVATTEALSFGLPVILSDIPSHRHLIEFYDPTAKLVRHSCQDIINAIIALHGKKSDVNLPNWTDIATDYLEIIE